MLEGLSIPRYAKAISRNNALGADNQQERPVGKKQIWRAKREVCGRVRLQPYRNGGKILRALVPEVWLSILLEILRDYMPDSNEKFVGKDIVRTAWRHAEGGRNVHPLSDLLRSEE